MNNCQQITEQISMYLDSMLDGQELVEFNKHIENCPECKKQLMTMQIIVDSTSAIEEVELPSGFRSSLRERLENEEITNNVVSYNKNKWYKNWRVYSAIAAVVLIAIAINSNMLNNITRMYYSGSSQAPQEAHSTQESHDEIVEEKRILPEKNEIARDTTQAKEPKILEEPQQFSITSEEPEKSDDTNNDDSQLSIMREDVDTRLTDRSLESENSLADPEVMKRSNSKLIMKKVYVNTISQKLDKVILELENNSELDYIVNYYIKDEILTVNINKEKSDEFIKFLEDINVPKDKRIITNDMTDDYMEFIAKHEDLIEKLNEYESKGKLNEIDKVREKLTQLESEINTIMFYIDKVAVIITTEPLIKIN